MESEGGRGRGSEEERRDGVDGSDARVEGGRVRRSGGRQDTRKKQVSIIRAVRQRLLCLRFPMRWFQLSSTKSRRRSELGTSGGAISDFAVSARVGYGVGAQRSEATVRRRRRSVAVMSMRESAHR
eukprot:6191921-Pleurochrysis_carterae.AAC.1